MKRFGSMILLLLGCFILSSCGGKGADLLILNWGDYISDEVIADFEEEYEVTVKIATVDSNEQMYQNILNQMAEYDLVIPSDYMIDQMKEEEMILPLDFDRLQNYREDAFVSGLTDLMNSSDCSDYKGYYIPYFWGDLGIMYSKRKAGVEEAVLKYGFSVLFEPDLLPKGAKVGMYNTSRDALAAAELYKGYSLNTTNRSKIDECMNLLKNTSFAAWGTDDLKIKVSSGNLDVALVYSGDFFDAYYADISAGALQNLEQYGIYAPVMHNNVFFDGIAMPYTVTNEDLAYRFIDYLLEFDHAYENTSFVGYCPTLQEVYDVIYTDEEWEEVASIEAYDPNHILKDPSNLAEVYRFLGNDLFEYIEQKFIEVIAG